MTAANIWGRYLNGDNVKMNEYKDQRTCGGVQEPDVANNETPDKSEKSSVKLSESQFIDLSIAIEQILMFQFDLSLKEARRYTRRTLAAMPNCIVPRLCAMFALGLHSADHPGTKYRELRNLP